LSRRVVRFAKQAAVTMLPTDEFAAKCAKLFVLSSNPRVVKF
jgi:hypothetical protein